METDTVYLFAIETVEPYVPAVTAKKIADTIKRTVGFLGAHPDEMGLFLVYNSLDNAVTAWHKFADFSQTANWIMRGELTRDRRTLTVSGPEQRMRLH